MISSKAKSSFILSIILISMISSIKSLEENKLADLSYEYFNKAFLIKKGSGGKTTPILILEQIYPQLTGYIIGNNVLLFLCLLTVTILEVIQN
jgi:hypothetical protein